MDLRGATTETSMRSPSSHPTLVAPGSLLSHGTLLALGSLLALGTGCTSRTRTFEGHSEPQVWSAMVAAAKAPRYDDWRVIENEVYADESTHTVRIFRVLRRTYVTPTAPPLEQSREWRFDAVLSRDEDVDAPMVDFSARQLAVASHVWSEADRYFLDMQFSLKPSDSAAAEPPAKAE